MIKSYSTLPNHPSNSITASQHTNWGSWLKVTLIRSGIQPTQSSQSSSTPPMLTIHFQVLLLSCSGILEDQFREGVMH